MTTIITYCVFVSALHDSFTPAEVFMHARSPYFSSWAIGLATIGRVYLSSWFSRYASKSRNSTYKL